MSARSGARAALTLGLVVSLAANVIGAHPSALGRLVAAWPPVALLVAVELVTRIPSAGGPRSQLRLVAAGVIAVLAAWASYEHMVGVAIRAGEGKAIAHAIPLSVDGLVVVASVCLRELEPTTGRRVAPVQRPAQPVDPSPAATPARVAATARPTATAEPGDGPHRAPNGEHVRRLAQDHPDWTQAQLAEAAGCSIRTIRRHLTTTAPAAAPAPTSTTAELAPTSEIPAMSTLNGTSA